VPDRTEQTRLIVAALASVLAHALTIGALAGSYGTLLGDDPERITREDAARKILLGIERSDAQTVDWIGYEEYRRHVAPTAENNQAQMAVGVPRTAPEEAERPEPARQRTTFRDAARAIEALILDRLFVDLENPDIFAAPERAREEGAPEERSENAAPSPPTAPPVPDAPEGNADKEADATSTEDEEPIEYTLGQPLAARGLDIRTVRPEWSVRTRLLARPRSPLVRMHFDRSGKVVEAEIEESTGHADVDRPLLDAIYRWRARGEGLERLPEDDPEAVIVIRLRIGLR